MVTKTVGALAIATASTAATSFRPIQIYASTTTTSTGRLSAITAHGSTSASKRLKRPARYPRTPPANIATVNAEMTRATVMQTFHGSSPSRMLRHARIATGTGPGNRRGDATSSAAIHHSRTNTNSESALVTF